MPMQQENQIIQSFPMPRISHASVVLGPKTQEFGASSAPVREFTFGGSNAMAFACEHLLPRRQRRCSCAGSGKRLTNPCAFVSMVVDRQLLIAV